MLLLLMIVCALSCFAWSGFPPRLNTHADCAYEALLMVAEKKIADEVENHADGPDFHREKCNKTGLGACRIGCACPISDSNTDCSDTHGHRISAFLMNIEENNELCRYCHEEQCNKRGIKDCKGSPIVRCNRGAEQGAAYWARRARDAYQKGDKKWIQYLGWATHYLADALCPAHCYDPQDPNQFHFWYAEDVLPLVPRRQNREFLFEIGLQVLDLYENYGWTLAALCNLLQDHYGFACDAVRLLLEWLRTQPGWQWLKNYRIWIRNPPFPPVIQFDANDIQGWIITHANMISRMRKVNQWPYLEENDLKKVFSWISHGIRGLYRYVTGQLSSSTTDITLIDVTATVLVIDVSGSMSWQWKGGIKIDSAKKAALQFLEQVANEPRPSGTAHLIGVVTFSSDARVVCPLTSDYAQARKTVVSLGTLTSTNMGAGLDTALTELEKVPTAKRFIILLSDGMTNTGKSREQILSTSVAEARKKGICIHTVGFGDPGDIDEDFLKTVASKSGCGTYNYASSGFELFGTYIKVRHAMLGSNRIVDFSSGASPVRMLSGQTATLGAFQLTAPAKELHFTLAWSEPGKMQAILVDPNNQKVTGNYPGVQIYSGNGFVHITVFSPKPGIWRASAAAVSSFVHGVQYYGVVSARTGGFVIPYKLPTPCFEVLGTEICIPVPDLPTTLIVIGSIAFVALGIYMWLTSP